MKLNKIMLLILLTGTAQILLSHNFDINIKDCFQSRARFYFKVPSSATLADLYRLASEKIGFEIASILKKGNLLPNNDAPISTEYLYNVDLCFITKKIDESLMKIYLRDLTSNNILLVIIDKNATMAELYKAVDQKAEHYLKDILLNREYILPNDDSKISRYLSRYDDALYFTTISPEREEFLRAVHIFSRDYSLLGDLIEQIESSGLEKTKLDNLLASIEELSVASQIEYLKDYLTYRLDILEGLKQTILEKTSPEDASTLLTKTKELRVEEQIKELESYLIVLSLD